MPAVAYATPVVADDMLFFAGWAPGDDFKMPSFDVLLKMTGQEKLGYVTQEGFDKTKMKGFFENNDTNHDGKITRDEVGHVAEDDGTAPVNNSCHRGEGRRPGRHHEVARRLEAEQGIALRVVRSCPTAGSMCWLKDGGLVARRTT